MDGHTHNGTDAKQVTYGDLLARAHDIISEHTAAGLTPGDLLTALTATTFGFVTPDPPPPPPFPVPLNGWMRTDILTEPGGAKTLMPINGAAATGHGMPMDGEVSYITVTIGADIGNAGEFYEIELYLNGAGTGLTARITGAGGTERFAKSAGSAVSFVEGDILELYDMNSGAVAAVDAQAVIWLLGT